MIFLKNVNEKGSIVKGNALFEKYIRQNFLKYIVVLIIYILGFFIGISVFNQNIEVEENSNEVSDYLNETIESFGNNPSNVVSEFVREDFFELLIFCVLSLSIVGLPIILILIFIKAISLGTTISALINLKGIGYGTSFSILIFMVPTIIKIFVILALVCSSIKFIENILRYKKEIKYEIIRHAFVILLAFLATCVVVLYRTISINIIDQILI